MGTFAQKQKPTLKAKTADSTRPGRVLSRQSHVVSSILHLQRTIGNQAVQQLLKTNPDSLEDSPNTTSATSHSGFDFRRIPVYSRTSNSVSFDANARAHYKLGLGTNLADIRIHTDEHAAASAEALAAEAYVKRSDHDDKVLHRHAAGLGPAVAPAIVQEVLRGPSRPIPADVRCDMETLLGHNFADVRVHTNERAAASAEAVASHAYTVGRHIVFATERFDPGSAQGRRLLAHELTHTANHPPGAPTPSGDLRISSPAEAAEQHAVSVSKGTAVPAAAPTAQPGLFRSPDIVQLNGVAVNQDRVTVPPVAGLSFSARITPANASPDITLDVVGDDATIAAGTTIDNNTGAITVAADQTGGSAHVEARQNATEPDGSFFQNSPSSGVFSFTAIPSGITSTSASTYSSATDYGGEFTHTFTSPGGGQTALEGSHVNERFPTASGTTLTITGQLGTLSITVNSPNSASAGWDLYPTGEMDLPDEVIWTKTLSARPFVVNASNPSPSHTLPQALTATQSFRNLTFPDQTYSSAVVASTTHRRAIEDRNDQLKVVTSANAAGINQEVVEDYAGPTVFRRCRATPASIPVAVPASPGETAPAVTTSTINVDAEGQTATPTFSIPPPDLGCTIRPNGVLTPDTTAGTVTVRAGDSANFDETTVTLTAKPSLTAFAINNGAASTANRIVTLNHTAATSSPTHSLPTHYMASEDADFTGASWQTYSASPSFTLSEGYSVKTVYLKLMNDAGESGVLNDTIDVAPPAPSPSPTPQP